MKNYIDLMSDVLISGEIADNRTDVRSRKIFGTRLEFDMADGFPAVTTKKLQFKSVVAELLWFLSGSTNAFELRDKYGCNIWTPWAGKNGDLGPVYGSQWRNFGGVDQIQKAVDDIRHNPTSRRIIVSAWNPPALPDMALPPCHLLFQFHVSELTHRLSLQVYQRSADMFLGVPFNIASYALLLHMVSSQTGHIPGRLIMVFGDTHVYENHEGQAKTQCARTPYPLPRLMLSPAPKSIFDYKPEHIELVDYQHHDALTGEVAV